VFLSSGDPDLVQALHKRIWTYKNGFVSGFVSPHVWHIAPWWPHKWATSASAAVVTPHLGLEVQSARGRFDVHLGK